MNLESILEILLIVGRVVLVLVFIGCVPLLLAFLLVCLLRYIYRP